MKAAFVLSATAGLFISTSAFAQERIRSSDYTGEDAIEVCYDWETGFEFERCERLPIPGATGNMGQTYTLADGTRRTLTADPRAVPFDPLTAAANDGAPPDEEDRSGVAEAIARETSGRGTTGASGTTATPMPAGGASPTVMTPSNADAENADGQSETAAETSRIVEENFVLPPVVAVFPGRSEIMQMATGHLNRIETPFSDPMVRTSAQADALNVEFDQNYIYISLTQPVTLFIHQRGNPDPAIVVSLVPQRIAPRQVKLTVPPTMLKEIEANAATKAKADATSAADGKPYTPPANSRGVTRTAAPGGVTATLPGYIQTFANGRIPRGFSQIPLQGYDARSFCKSSGGVNFSFTQGAVVASTEYVIVRGMVTSNREVDLDERVCAQHPDTLAVAFAPRTRVSKDHPTDFFVLFRRPDASVQSARGN